MNSILESLYNCAMENRHKCYLSRDEERDYHSSLLAGEKREEQLAQILDGESLHLFKLYVDNSEESNYLQSLSSFRKGLAIGLKLGAFAMSDY